MVCTFLVFALLLLLAGFPSQGAAAPAGDYPNKPITWVIPFDPGSGADTFARTLGKAASKVLGYNFVYVNRAGGSGGIALSYLKTRPTDGYTIASHSISLIFSLASGEIPFTFDNIDFITRCNADPQVIVVPSSSPFQTIDDLVNHAKANPGQLNMGGVGAFSNSSVCSDMFKQGAGIDYKYIPYNGGNAATVAVLGANLDALWVTSSNVSAQIDAGKLRLLVTANSERNPKYPDVPTCLEKGYKFESILWRGIIALPGIPKERIAVLEKAFETAMQDPEWLDYMDKQQQLAAYLPSEGFTKAARAEFAIALEAYTKRQP